MMSDRLWVGSRKGLFELRKAKIAKHHFAGQPVSAFLQTKTELLCALNLGHFGAKLWRSRDEGKTWQEVAAPAYPKEPRGAQGVVRRRGRCSRHSLGVARWQEHHLGHFLRRRVEERRRR